MEEKKEKKRTLLDVIYDRPITFVCLCAIASDLIVRVVNSICCKD